AGDEVDEAGEERLALVLAVMALGRLARDLHQLHADDAEALRFEARDDGADEPTANAVGLDHGESTFDSHNGRVYHGLLRFPAARNPAPEVRRARRQPRRRSAAHGASHASGQPCPIRPTPSTPSCGRWFRS